MIQRMTLKYDKHGYDAGWIHEYLGRGLWDVVCAGDLLLLRRDLRDSNPKASARVDSAIRHKKDHVYFCT